MTAKLSRMGGAAAQHVLPRDRFAFRVVEQEFKRIKGNLSLEDDGDDVYSPDEIQLHDRLASIYSNGLLEFDLSIEECRTPAVIICKYEDLGEVEKDSFHNIIIETLIQRGKASMSNAVKKEIDYSKSFGGTADDTKNEKEAAALLRGTEEAIQEACAHLVPPNIMIPFDKKCLRRAGEWKKYLGAGCFMYVHVLTKEIVSTKPSDYVEEVNESNTVTIEARDPANGLRSVALANLPSEIDKIINEEKKTPLILDPLDVGARAFYSYKHILEDVSAMTIPFAKSGLKRSDVLENTRKSLVAALKRGRLFALYLGATSIEHADWKKKLCKKDVFPVDVFQQGGARLLQPANEPRFKLLFREDDLEHGQAIAREGFGAVFISSLDPYEYESKLEDSIPLGYMVPLYITT